MKRYIHFIKNYILLHQIHPQDNSIIHRTTLVSNKTFFEGKNWIENSAVLLDSKVGFGSFIGSKAYLPNTKIGKYTSIASGVEIVVGAHPTHTFVSTHPAFYKPNRPIFTFVDREPKSFSVFKKHIDEYNIIIGNDVWIGKDVKIMPGITIGTGAIIGTGSIITKDIPAYAIAVGVPAKVIKYRFDKSTIEYLLTDKWWEKGLEQIKANSSILLNVEDYLNRGNL